MGKVDLGRVAMSFPVYYVQGTTYNRGDLVYWLTSTYICMTNGTTTPPAGSVTDNWRIISKGFEPNAFQVNKLTIDTTPNVLTEFEWVFDKTLTEIPEVVALPFYTGDAKITISVKDLKKTGCKFEITSPFESTPICAIAISSGVNNYTNI